MRNDKENLIVKLSFEFALDIIKLSDTLYAQKKFVLMNQVLKSGTSIGANIREAQNAESKPDFIHKMKIAVKEADETHSWLELMNQSEGYPVPVMLIEKCEVSIKILSKIISSSKVE